MHYENVLGNIEVQLRRHSQLQQSYHGMYAWLIELVYILLYQRHILNETLIAGSLRFLEGIVGLARASAPLWVFSLNHDLIIECLAAHYDLRLDCGFSGTNSLPLRDERGSRIGDLPVQSLDGDRFRASGLDFKSLTTPGINLIKIHGALDVFTINDGRDLIKLAPLGSGVPGVLKSLRAANENLLYTEPGFPGGKVKTTNEISYADEQGVMQFMRRTLLAGAFKFDQRSPQVLPHAFLEQFRGNLNHVSRLVCIGYGYGDAHINAILRQWLEFSGSRRIELVAPGTRMCPSFLGHLAGQVTLKDAFATDYLEHYALSPLSFWERTSKVGRRRARARQRRVNGFA